MTTFAILGAGNAGYAFAAHLTCLGHGVRLYDPFAEQIVALAANPEITITGNVPCGGETAVLGYVGTDLRQAVTGAEIIMCATPAHIHRQLAQSLSPHLSPDQVVVLNPGRTGGALEFGQALRDGGFTGEPHVVEAQTLLYACRREARTVRIFGLKDSVRCAGLTAEGLQTFLSTMAPILPQFTVAEQGLWETSLDNIGMLFHPAPTLFNLGRMESGTPFDYYVDGMSPSIARLVEQLDEERCQVARAMGIAIPSAVEWLTNAYGAQGSTLYEAIQANEAYRGIQAPRLQGIEAKRELRYVVEDVPTGLVPTAALGSVLGVATPTMDLVIDVANQVYARDFRQEGRTLGRLGLEGRSAAELRELGGSPRPVG